MLIEIFLKSSFLPGLLLVLVLFFLRDQNTFLQDRTQSIVAVFCFLLGTYFLKGLPAFPPSGGVTDFQYLALLFVLYAYVPSPLFFLIFSFLFLLFPFYQNSAFTRPLVQNSFAFAILAWSLWSFADRQIERGFRIPAMVSALVVSVAGSVLALLKSSALISQSFGILATMAGFVILFVLIFGPKFSDRMFSGIFIGFPLVLLSALHLFMDVNPYLVMSMTLPYAILIVRTGLRYEVRKPWREAIGTFIFSVASVAYPLYSVFVTSEPLY